MIAIPARKSKINLLVVDDDTELTEFLRAGLEKYFSLVAIASSLADGKMYLSGRVSFHAVLCDYYLPDGNGLELYDWLRDDRKLLTPFILISGRTDIRPGPGKDFTFLAKPFGFSDVIERLPVVADMA
ncbi:MAG: response regulator [Candidatus Methylacidiphilales bacterium]|nr:response regulator [Candidatus Methylacidiphilales bacterium]